MSVTPPGVSARNDAGHVPTTNTDAPAAFQPTVAGNKDGNTPDAKDQPVGQCFASHPDDSTTRTVKTNAGFHVGSVQLKGEITRSVQRKQGPPDENGKGAYTITVTEKGAYKASADLSENVESGAERNRAVASTYKFDTPEDADRAATILGSPVNSVEDDNWVRQHPLVSRSETIEVSGSETFKPGGDSKLGDAVGAGSGSTGTRTQTRTVEYGDDGKAKAIRFSTETTQNQTTDAGSTKIGGDYKKASGSLSTGVGTSEQTRTTREVCYDISNDPDAGERLSAQRDDASRILDPTQPGVFFKGAEDPSEVLKEKGRLDQPDTLTVTSETSTPILDPSGIKQVKTTRTETTDHPSLQPGGTPDDRDRTVVDTSTRVVSNTRNEAEGTVAGRYGLEYGAGVTDETEKIEQETKGRRTDLGGNPVH